MSVVWFLIGLILCFVLLWTCFFISLFNLVRLRIKSHHPHPSLPLTSLFLHPSQKTTGLHPTHRLSFRLINNNSPWHLTVTIGTIARLERWIILIDRSTMNLETNTAVVTILMDRPIVETPTVTARIATKTTPMVDLIQVINQVIVLKTLIIKWKTKSDY